MTSKKTLEEGQFSEASSSPRHDEGAPATEEFLG